MFRFNRIHFITSNFIISFLSFMLIFNLRYSWIKFAGIERRIIDFQTIFFFIFYSLVIIIFSISLKIYELNKLSYIKESLISNILVSLLSMGIFGTFFYFTQIKFARFVFFAGFLVIPVFLSVINKYLFAFLKNSKPVEILYLGAKNNYMLLINLVKEYEKWFPVKLTGPLNDTEGNRLKKIIKKYNYLVIDTDCNYPKNFRSIIDDYEVRGGKIYTLIDMFEYFDQSLPSEIIKNSHYELFSFYKLNSFYSKFLKRAGDIIISLCLLVILLPVLLITCILTLITVRGKIFFYQKRSSINNKIFKIIKFKTMNDEKGMKRRYFTDKDDERITFIGRVIRPLHIDEIPQLLNILKGDMSFIGPRPERPEIISEIIKKYPLFKKRLLVKPGLTGWAQVKYSYVNKIENMNKKLSYDLYYLNNISFILDMKILLYTLETVIFRRGTL